MNAHVPFAVVGSTEFVKLGSKMIRARQYPWGIVQGKFYWLIQLRIEANVFCAYS